ncbi:MAG: hypothetical protein R3Y32_07360 [Bacillota bacterium]
MKFEKGNTINIQIIEDFLQTNNLSKTQFCKRCKISPQTLKKVMSQNLDFGMLALFKIAHTIGINMHEMFE